MCSPFGCVLHFHSKSIRNIRLGQNVELNRQLDTVPKYTRDEFISTSHETRLYLSAQTVSKVNVVSPRVCTTSNRFSETTRMYRTGSHMPPSLKRLPQEAWIFCEQCKVWVACLQSVFFQAASFGVCSLGSV